MENKGMSRKRTIEDIARLAGVSKATVSRVINRKPDVDPATRQRILDIMEEVSFIPSITASGLAGGRRRLIGILVPSFTTPFVPSIVHGITEVIGNTLYELALYNWQDKTREHQRSDVIDYILSTNFIAGLLAIIPGKSSQFAWRLHEQGLPVVLIDDETAPPQAPWVGINNQQGAYEAVRYLLQLGHTRIAHIHGPRQAYSSQERQQGYERALREAGIPIDPTLVIEGDYSFESGQAAGSKLIELSERPDAIFASGDLMAYGVIEAAEIHNLKIPRDLSLVGFDDLPSSRYIRPPLTTVRQPFEEMGKSGAKMLLSIINQQHQNEEHLFDPFNIGAATPIHSDLSTKPTPHICLEANLQVRATCREKIQKAKYDQDQA
jgi:LacI family transcriptional regulator